MSHPQQMDFIQSVKDKFPELFSNSRILEIGSLDINGSIRRFFTDCFYIGVDIAEGPGVDVVALGNELDFSSETFDMVISCECFEHNPFWWETFLNMIRMSKGIVVFTCATEGRQEHGTTASNPECSPLTVEAGWNYYQNLTVDDFASLPLDEIFSRYEFTVNRESCDLYFWGDKRSAQ